MCRWPKQRRVPNSHLIKITMLAVFCYLQDAFIIWESLVDWQGKGVGCFQEAGPDTLPILGDVQDSLLHHLLHGLSTHVCPKAAPSNPA